MVGLGRFWEERPFVRMFGAGTTSGDPTRQYAITGPDLPEVRREDKDHDPGDIKRLRIWKGVASQQSGYRLAEAA
jgi:hypothetical protein